MGSGPTQPLLTSVGNSPKSTVFGETSILCSASLCCQSLLAMSLRIHYVAAYRSDSFVLRNLSSLVRILDPSLNVLCPLTLSGSHLLSPLVPEAGPHLHLLLMWLHSVPSFSLRYRLLRKYCLTNFLFCNRFCMIQFSPPTRLQPGKS